MNPTPDQGQDHEMCAAMQNLGLLLIYRIEILTLIFDWLRHPRMGISKELSEAAASLDFN